MIVPAPDAAVVTVIFTVICEFNQSPDIYRVAVYIPADTVSRFKEQSVSLTALKQSRQLPVGKRPLPFKRLYQLMSFVH